MIPLVIREMSARRSSDASAAAEMDPSGKAALFRLLGVSGSNMPIANIGVHRFPNALQASWEDTLFSLSF